MLTEEQRAKMLQCPKGPVDMVLDTDAYNEIDDQFAIAYALRAVKLTVKALYAAPFSNQNSSGPADGMEKSYQEINKLLKLLGEEKPVFRGSVGYLHDEKTPVESEAAEDLCSRAMEYSPEHPLYVAAIGAITNIASALLMQPEIADRVVVVWLGGHAVHYCDNREFNMRQDIAAARVVFGSGVPLVILPCAGVVDCFSTTEHELRAWLSGKNALCDYLVENTVNTANKYARGKVWSRVIWDVTTIAWLLNDGNKFMMDKLIPTPIPEYDFYYAWDIRRPLCRYVYHIRRDALMGDLFFHLVKE